MKTNNEQKGDKTEETRRGKQMSKMPRPVFRIGQSPQLGQPKQQQQHIWHLGACDKAIKTPTKTEQQTEGTETERARNGEKGMGKNKIELN